MNNKFEIIGKVLTPAELKEGETNGRAWSVYNIWVEVDSSYQDKQRADKFELSAYKPIFANLQVGSMVKFTGSVRARTSDQGRVFYNLTAWKVEPHQQTHQVQAHHAPQARHPQYAPPPQQHHFQAQPHQAVNPYQAPQQPAPQQHAQPLPTSGSNGPMPF